jgi:hypothetical protein
MALALMSQAGVAIAMALLAATKFPQVSDVILPIVISTTVLFEVCGPVMTRFALRKASPDADGTTK